MIKKHAFLVFLVIVALLIVAGCSSGEPQTYTNPATTINVKANKEFIIALEANATTGFAWETVFDETMLQLVSQDYVPDEYEEGMVGVGGTDHLRFKALQSGSTKIELTYKRPWEEGEGEFDEHLIFTVEIN